MTLADRVRDICPAPTADAERTPRLRLSVIGWAGQCDRRLAYHHHGVRESDPPSPAAQRKMALGWTIEDAVIQWMEDSGIRVIARQLFVVWHGIAGHIDGMLEDDDGPAVFDIKSMSRFSFRKFARHGFAAGPFTSSYRGQLQTYMAALGTPRGYVIAVDRDSTEVHAVCDERDEAYLEDLSIAIRRVRDSRRPDELARGTGYSRSHVACRYCSWHSECWGEGLL